MGIIGSGSGGDKECKIAASLIASHLDASFRGPFVRLDTTLETCYTEVSELLIV